MRREAVVLNDYQSAMMCDRGTSSMLILQQEELTEANGQVISPAKSFTLSRKDEVVKLYGFLEVMLREPMNELPESPSSVWGPIRKEALKRVEKMRFINANYFVSALSNIIRSTLGISSLNSMREEHIPAVTRLVDAIISAMLVEEEGVRRS